MKISLVNYNIDQYLKDIGSYGLEIVWNNILNNYDSTYVNTILDLENWSELYELGLAQADKSKKKKMGQYFTPKDVAKLMSEYLIPLKGENICDICCGTGNLIVEYLKALGYEKAQRLLNQGYVWLYDIDQLALNICLKRLDLVFELDTVSNIHSINTDILDSKCVLPDNCKVISNPPYAKIEDYKETWDKTKVLTTCKDYYAAIMEKILLQSESAVIITPHSFVGSNKFYELRKLMNNYNGLIINYDNVPASIFNGKKKGVFNSNSSNSVRASITVVENKEDVKGFRVSGLIRFKAEEREQALTKDIINQCMGIAYQKVDRNKKAFAKVFPQMELINNTWKNMADSRTVKDLTTREGMYILSIPNTCRYYLSASVKYLDRAGKLTLYFDSKDFRNYVYLLINSSFVYWYWRVYDGGITLTSSLLNGVPQFFNKLTDQQQNDLNRLAESLIEKENKYFVYKKNAGKLQENLKFPVEIRREINKLFFEIMGIDMDCLKYFELVHSNSLNLSYEEQRKCIRGLNK